MCKQTISKNGKKNFKTKRNYKKNWNMKSKLV